jgi:hypothetical protein
MIAIGMQGKQDGDKGTVGIFQRNSKDDGWDVLKVLRDPEQPYRRGSLFGSDVVITDDYVVATPVGNDSKLDNGIYLYNCRSETGKVLYTDGGEYKRNGDADIPAGIPFYEYRRRVASGNGMVLLTAPYLDTNDALMNTDIVGRIVVFEKKGAEWDVTGTIDATKADTPPGSDRLYLVGPAVFFGETIAARINSSVLVDGKKYYKFEPDLYAFERGADGLWGQGKKIEMPPLFLASLGIVIDNEIIVIGDHQSRTPEYNGKNQFLVYRKNESGWGIGSGRNKLTADKSHDTIVIKANIREGLKWY